MKKIIALTLVIIMAFSLTACSDKKSGANSDTELANVGETTITSGQLDEYFALMTYLQNMDITQIPPETVETLKAELLKNMVEMEAMEQYYADSEVLPPTAKEDVKKFIDESRATDGVGTFLTENKISDETLDNFFKSQFYAEEFYSEVEKSIPTLEEDCKKYYEENKQLYKSEEVKASHILISKKENATADEIAKAKKTAEKVLIDLQAGTVTFEDMAAKYNEDSTKTTGGDLGFFGKGQMVAEFEEAAFKLEKDQLSGVVETEFGFHIIKVTDKREYVPYEEVKDQIKMEKTDPTYKEKMEGVLKKLGVEYLTDIKPTEKKAE